jgi:outer membrane receptor protein involved in Fe transport
MIKFTASTLVFIVLYLGCFAQKAILSGHVTDEDGKAMEYVSVSLIPSTGGNPVAGTLTNSKGEYELNPAKTGEYTIKLTFLGYANKFINPVQIKGDKKIAFATITMQPDQKLLHNVEVKGQKDAVIGKIDKQVYRADQFQSARGGNAIDVIKNMPSVSVNSQGEITMRGSSGFLVLINGKPVQVDVETILNQLPANGIENIELITSPSAKYDADGKGGIINIITKKGATNGLSIAANTQGGLPSLNDFNNKKDPRRFGGDATINYKTNQWDISVGGNYLRNDIAGRREGDVNTTVDNRYTHFPSAGERSFKRSNYAARANITYTPDPENSITAGFYHGSRTQYRLADLVYNNTKTDVNTGQIIGKTTYYNSNVVKRQGDFTLGNLDYNHVFKNKSTLTLSGVLEYDMLQGYTHNRNLNYPDTTTLQQYTVNTNSNPLHGYRLQADYAVTIGPGKLESGYQWKYQKQNGNFLTQVQDSGTGDLITQSDNVTDVRNDIQSLYSQYSGKAGKLQYTGGVRYEYSTRDFSTAQTANLYNLKLSNLFPSANLLYTFNDNWKAKAGFSRRVQRTSFTELNPYPEREHSETFELGDPNLLPEFVNLTELGVIRPFSQGSFFATLYHQDISNAINRVNKVVTDTILYRLYTNAGKANLWGVEFGGDIKINKWWQLYLGANLFNYHIRGNLFENSVQVNNSSWNYTINGNTNISFSKTSSFQFNVNYLSARATAQGKDSRFIVPNSSFRQTFYKGRLAASLQWQDMDFGILHTNQQRITTSGTNFYTTTNYIQETNIFLLNLSFSINQSSKKPKLPNSEFGDKEF